jgi:mercuric ion transport protein
MQITWNKRMTALDIRGSLAAGVLAAIGASLCCVVPLVLLALGIGGAWIGNLTALEPYRPIFIGLTLLFLGLAFRQLYVTTAGCAPGRACADPKVLARQRTVFWAVVVLLGVLLAVPWLAPLFY